MGRGEVVVEELLVEVDLATPEGCKAELTWVMVQWFAIFRPFSPTSYSLLFSIYFMSTFYDLNLGQLKIIWVKIDSVNQ